MKSSLLSSTTMASPLVCNYYSSTSYRKPYQFNRQLDVTFLQDFYENDLETACMMFNIFLDSTFESCKEIFISYSAGEYKQFKYLVHKIRSSFKMVGLGELDKIFYRLENAPIEDFNGIGVKSLMQLFKKALNRYLPIIKAEAKKLGQLVLT